jgi:predicted Zn-dependent peptidase
LAIEPVGERELTKIKNGIDAEFVWASYSNMGLAGYLADAQTLAKDWSYLGRYRNNLLAVTAEDIMRVSGQYLTEERSTVATLIPKEKGGDS